MAVLRKSTSVIKVQTECTALSSPTPPLPSLPTEQLSRQILFRLMYVANTFSQIKVVGLQGKQLTAVAANDKIQDFQ